MTSKPLIIIDDDDDDRPNPVINRPKPSPDRNRKSFPELVGMTEVEAKTLLKRKYGKDGYSQDSGQCYLRNIDFNRVCYKLGDKRTIISTPFSG